MQIHLTEKNHARLKFCALVVGILCVMNLLWFWHDRDSFRGFGVIGNAFVLMFFWAVEPHVDALGGLKGLLLRVIGIAAGIAVLAYVVIPGLMVTLGSFDNPASELARAFR